MQYGIEFEPQNTRKKRMHILRLLCRQLNLKPLRIGYMIPIHYHHHIDMQKVHKCIPGLIKQLQLPSDIRKYIEWLTKVVNKKPMSATHPKYLNHKHWIKEFDENPWEHCQECLRPDDLWTNAPRQLAPLTENTRCISLFPAQHPPLYHKCRALVEHCDLAALLNRLRLNPKLLKLYLRGFQRLLNPFLDQER